MSALAVNTGLRLVEAVCDPLFHGYRWDVVDQKDLARLMAHLALGEYRYVARILQGLSAKDIPPAAAALEKRIDYIRNPSREDHRDGWLFQMLAWIAAYQADPNAMITPPHQQPAFKGFDSLLLRVDGGAKLCGVTIGEDKMTKNARTTITAKVWPEIREFEGASRDDELVSTVTTLLERFFPHDVEAHLETAFWKKDARTYRVCIGSHDFKDDDAGRRELFGGYADVAKGDRDRRRAETLYTPGDVREWMKALATHVAEALAALRDEEGNV
jgi:hypothetical protein